MVACAGCAYEERRGGDFLQVHPALIYAQRGGGRNPFRSHFSNPPRTSLEFNRAFKKWESGGMWKDRGKNENVSKGFFSRVTFLEIIVVVTVNLYVSVKHNDCMDQIEVVRLN